MTDAYRKKMASLQKALLLFQHGTEPCELSPRAIVQTAEQDLRSHQHNARVRAERRRIIQEFGKGGPGLATLEPTRRFGFLPRHVNTVAKGSNLAADLIRLAIAERWRGAVQCGPDAGEESLIAVDAAITANSARIYASEAKLTEALRIAETAVSERAA